MRISIGFKLMALAGIGSAMLAYAGLYGTWSSWHATDSLHAKLDESNLEQHDLLAIQAEFLMEAHAWDSLLKSIDETSLKTSWDIYDAQFNKVSASVNEALKHTSCNEARVHLASFADQHAKNRELYKKAAETFRLNSFDATPADALVDLIERKPLQILANAMSDSTQEITRYSHDIADSSRTHVYWSVGLLIAVFLLEGIVFIALVRHFLSKPTAKVLNSLKKLEAGDFTGTIEKHYDDELGEIAESTYQVSQHLGQLIVNVQRAAHRLAETAQRVAMVSSMTSEGVKNQREETDSASRSMKEMSDSMQLSVERADEAVATASSVSQQVVVVNGVLNETVRAVQALADEVKNTAVAIQTLKNETQNIGDVAKTIRSIADQTNLLALNAAIEAARAGEQGRGFAVVADEVRKLAQITQNATSDIEQRIDTLQAGASNAMSAMMEGCERADKSVEQATAARKVLESITQAAASIREINEHIVEILGDQKIVANTITGTILNISQVAEQTAHSSRQTSEEVVNVAVEAVRLDEMVEAFILPAGEELKPSGTALTRPATKDDSVELF